MNRFEKEYCIILRRCLLDGEEIIGRNGKTKQLINVSLKANLNDGFPIVTGKQIYPKSCFIETEWMLKGFTNIKFLNDRGVNIWNQWADDKGDLGPVYGKQIINFGGINQIDEINKEFIMNNYSRRLVVNMWNPKEIGLMALPPCHYSFQFIVHDNDRVDIIVTMRSLDLFIGLPYDIVMYSCILQGFCNEHGLKSNNIHINAANAHIYEEHYSLVNQYCNSEKYDLPYVTNKTTLSNFDSNLITIENYKFGPRLKTKIIK